MQLQKKLKKSLIPQLFIAQNQSDLFKTFISAPKSKTLLLITVQCVQRSTDLHFLSQQLIYRLSKPSGCKRKLNQKQ
jgi:hypothetical protein